MRFREPAQRLLWLDLLEAAVTLDALEREKQGGCGRGLLQNNDSKSLVAN